VPRPLRGAGRVLGEQSHAAEATKVQCTSWTSSPPVVGRFIAITACVEDCREACPSLVSEAPTSAPRCERVAVADVPRPLRGAGRVLGEQSQAAVATKALGPRTDLATPECDEVASSGSASGRFGESDAAPQDGKAVAGNSEATDGWCVVASKRTVKKPKMKEPFVAAAPRPEFRRLVSRVPVGIEDEPAFRVIRRLIGPGGENMRRLTDGAEGAKVWVSGKGVQTRNATESEEPLTIRVIASTTRALEVATANVEKLLGRVHSEYRKFCAAKGLPEPTLVVRREKALRT